METGFSYPGQIIFRDKYNVKNDNCRMLCSSALLYCAETWKMSKKLERVIVALEMWIYRIDRITE